MLIFKLLLVNGETRILKKSNIYNKSSLGFTSGVIKTCAREHFERLIFSREEQRWRSRSWQLTDKKNLHTEEMIFLL